MLRNHRRHDLPGGRSYVALAPPTDLLARGCAPLRAALVEVCNEAFGSETAETWQQRFAGDFLARLRRFYLLFDTSEALIGWSGYRAHTIRGERIVYFDSTGLLPAHQGHGLIPLIQRAAIAEEKRRHSGLAVSLVIRTRSPHGYRVAMRAFSPAAVVPTLEGTVPEARRALVADTATWLGQHPFDPVTARITDAYGDRRPLYGNHRAPLADDAHVNRLFAALGPADALLVFARDRPS
jgi:hypothetical protein